MCVLTVHTTSHIDKYAHTINKLKKNKNSHNKMKLMNWEILPNKILTEGKTGTGKSKPMVSPKIVFIIVIKIKLKIILRQGLSV